MKILESNIFLIPIICLVLLILFFPYTVVDWKPISYQPGNEMGITPGHSFMLTFEHTSLFFDRVLCVKLWYEEHELKFPKPIFDVVGLGHSFDHVPGDHSRMTRGKGVVSGDHFTHIHMPGQHISSCPFKLDLAPYTQKLQL